MANRNTCDLDSIWEKLGTFGKYSIVNYMLLLFPIYLAGMYGTIYVFEAPDLNYRCKIPECDSSVNVTEWLHLALPEVKGSLSKCTRHPFVVNRTDCKAHSFANKLEERCVEFIYSDEDSIVRDFDLGCQDWKRTLVGSIHNAGLFISLPLTGLISDRYGRKIALPLASLMSGVFGVMRSFSVNYTMLIAFEFLESAFGAGAYTTAFVLAMEMVGPNDRVFVNTLINVVYVFGLFTIAGFAWLLQSWRVLLRAIYTPSLFVLSYLWILNESVRWLLSKGRNEEAVEILKKAAAMNKVDLNDHVSSPMFVLCSNKTKVEDSKSADKNDASRSTLLRVLKSSVLRQRVFVCSFLWITCTFVYYGLSINSVSLAGNKYVNFMLVACVEIPANFVCLLIADRFGRKKTLMTTYIVSAFLCIGLSFIPKDAKWICLLVYLSGKFSITVAYSSLYVYVSEVFPTNLRQFLLAVCSCIGRVGSTLAPLTPLLGLYYERLPSIFFGCMAFVAGMLVFSVPETINLRLPDTLEEAERLSSLTTKIQQA